MTVILSIKYCARNNHEKEYTVTVNKPITERFIERMGNGIPILDTVLEKSSK
jgi:23S rRNA pseudouridine2604 synthase